MYISDMDVPPMLLDLFRAYYDARRNKRTTESALRFELDFEAQLFVLYEELNTRTYRISPATCFVVTKPVRREIFAGDFRDRVVHHLIYNYLAPLCERVFIFDSYACRVGKGTTCGIRRADHFIRSVSRNYTRDCYTLKLDVSGYFMSIDRAILYEKMVALVARYRGVVAWDADFLLWLLRVVIFHDHTAHCLMRGRPSDWDGLSASKSLFYAAPGCGLPIGNLTSQMFGNIYLNDFDHVAAALVPGARYGRYVDDMLFVGPDAQALARAILTVGAYLHEKLALTPHPKKCVLQHYTKGVDFLGVSLRPGRIYVRHRIKCNIYRCVRSWNARAATQSGVLAEEQVEALLASLNSYLGALAPYRTRRLRRKVCSYLSDSLLRYVVPGRAFKRVRMRSNECGNPTECVKCTCKPPRGQGLE